MTLHRLALPVLALALGTPSLLMAGNGVSPSTAIQDDDRRHDRGDWNAPPSEFRDVQRQGYRDGIDAGREDAEHHRHNMEKSRMYRHPPVRPETRNEYREGFRRSYDTAMSHFKGDHDHDRPY